MIRFVGKTDIGLVRESNQDRYECRVLSEDTAFAVLCDGMGGHSGGNVASETTVSFITERLSRDLTGELGEKTIKRILDSAVAGANSLVYEAAQNNPELSSMGTTLIAAVFYKEDVYISYVGDSRVYVLSPDEEIQLTKDHTVVQMLVDLGEITVQDALSHPKRHYITRAIGVASSVEVDFLSHRLEQGEVVMLCSDGLYNFMQPGTFYSGAMKCLGDGNADILIDIAKDGGGTDNITVIVADNQPISGGNSTDG